MADGPTGALAGEAQEQRKGQQVVKLGPDGTVLLRLGIAGVTGGPADRDRFNAPADMLVAPDGDVYVLDGHGAGGNNRVVRFDASGRYLGEWGTSGPGPAAGEMSDPHAIAMDSGAASSWRTAATSVCRSSTGRVASWSSGPTWGPRATSSSTPTT